MTSSDEPEACQRRSIAEQVWLSEMDLDISLVQYKAYRSSPPDSDGGQAQILVTVSQLYPVRDVEDFMVSPSASRPRNLVAACGMR